MSERTRAGRGRRPGAPDTRAEILASARALFADRGFASTSVRAVAADAGVDPALVHHYFGTKDDLFVAALELPVDPRVALAPVVEGGVDGAGERLLRVFLSVWDDEDARLPLLGLVRGVVDPEGRMLLRDGLFGVVLGPIGDALGLDEPQRRIALVASQMIGLVMLRYVLEVEPLASMDQETLVATYAPTLQRYLDRGRLPRTLTGEPSRVLIHHMMKNAVAVRSLRVIRGGNEVLRDLDFEVGPGQVTGLLGPSGCGKTTLMRAIVGVQRITGGTVEVLGAPAGSRVAARPDRLRHPAAERVRRPHRHREPPLLRPDPRRRARPGRRVHRDGGPRTTSATTSSASSPAASARGSRWRSPCSASRRCSSSTSPPSASTRCCGWSCGTPSTGSPTRAPPCWSPAT